MLITYKNRKNELHYLRAAKTKKGGKRYYIVKNKEKYADEELLEEIPDSFEFYESPYDARVSLRKIIQPAFTPNEIRLVNAVMQQQTHVDDFILDSTAEGLMVYAAGHKRADFEYLNDSQFLILLVFDEVLFFTKNTDGHYVLHRFCQLSQYYGWIPLETHPDLKYLAEKYCPHIQKESLLRFWIEGEEDY